MFNILAVRTHYWDSTIRHLRQLKPSKTKECGINTIPLSPAAEVRCVTVFAKFAGDFDGGHFEQSSGASPEVRNHHAAVQSGIVF